MNRPDYRDTPDTFLPAWASAYGQDPYGYWADLYLDENDLENSPKQRFRWIPAGEFMMGSPEHEVERNSSENYHQVTLSHGFWLADTACSQAFWQAIMGDNPAHFTLSGQHPVERVSWHDTQDFVQRLNKKVASLNTTLPSEAQWEYACRAASTSAFNFGEAISSKQVNFNGERPYADTPKSEFRKETVEVDSLSQNAWGLYQMHGNVWEWCQDHWQAELGTKAVTDPKTITDDEEGRRVLRGGSWISLSMYCRSAIRYHYAADVRYNLCGFRLSLGLEL